MGVSSALIFLIRPQISVLAAQQHPPQRQKDICPDRKKVGMNLLVLY